MKLSAIPGCVAAKTRVFRRSHAARVKPGRHAAAISRGLLPPNCSHTFAHRASRIAFRRGDGMTWRRVEPRARERSRAPESLRRNPRGEILAARFSRQNSCAGFHARFRSVRTEANGWSSMLATAAAGWGKKRDGSDKSRVPSAGRQEPGAKSRVPRAWRQEPRAKSQESRVKSETRATSEKNAERAIAAGRRPRLIGCRGSSGISACRKARLVGKRGLRDFAGRRTSGLPNRAAHRISWFVGGCGGDGGRYRD